MKPSKSVDQVLKSLTRREVLGCLRDLDARMARDALLRQLLMTRLTSAPTIPSQDNESLTMPQVARLLKVSVGRAYELHRSGELPTVILGERQVRVRRSDFNQYLQQRRTANIADRQ